MPGTYVYSVLSIHLAGLACWPRTWKDICLHVSILEQFAYTEASYVTIRLLQHFDLLQNMDPVKDIKLHTAIENRSGTGVQVILHEAA
jgi:hypothetical protein